MTNPTILTLNCRFARRFNRKFEYRTVANVKIFGLDWCNDGTRIREILNQFKPVGEGWAISGYALINNTKED